MSMFYDIACLSSALHILGGESGPPASLAVAGDLQINKPLYKLACKQRYFTRQNVPVFIHIGLLLSHTYDLPASSFFGLQQVAETNKTHTTNLRRINKLVLA